MTTGERIRKRRKELGMSADQLGDLIGVHRTTIYRYEKGDIEKISYQSLVPFARALRTTVGYLVGWDKEAPSDDTVDGDEEEIKNLFDGFSEAAKVEALNYLRYLASREGK